MAFGKHTLLMDQHYATYVLLPSPLWQQRLVCSQEDRPKIRQLECRSRRFTLSNVSRFARAMM